MLVFGGVVDQEQHHHRMDSVFYNDLMALDIERRKWLPLRVKDKISNKTGGSRRRRRRDNDSDSNNREDLNDADEHKEEVDSSDSDLEEDEASGDEEQKIGWDLDMLRSNMFAFVDGDGNIVYEKIYDEHEEEKEDKVEDEEVKEEEKDDNDDDEEKEEEKVEGGNVHTSNPKQSFLQNREASVKSHADPKRVTSSSVMILDETTNTPEAVQRTEPLPRINASTLVQGHRLYLLGGILEVGDREVTLDDMWTLDLRKRDKWECLWQGTMHRQVWRGAIHDDDDSYISTGKEDGSDDEDDDEGDFSEEENGVDNSKKSSKQKRACWRQEVAELNEKYGLDDVNRTPNSGESLADFYSRSSEYWNAQAAGEIEGTTREFSNKELKRKGFSLAKKRYEELEPVFGRLAALGIGEKRNNNHDLVSKEKKKDKKKSSKR
jgi:hypothetical protein